MGAPCSICTHRKRAQIDEAIVAGNKRASIEKRFGVLPDAIRRHEQNHIDDELRKSIMVDLKHQRIARLDAELNQDRSDISKGLNRIIGEIDGILQRAKEAGDDGMALVALRDMRHTLLDLAKLHGQLQNISTVRVEIGESPQWAQLKNILIEVFNEVPQAREVFARKTAHMRLIEAK